MLFAVKPKDCFLEMCFTDLPVYDWMTYAEVEATLVSIVQPQVPMDGIPACQETSRGRSGTHPRSAMRNQRAIFFGKMTTYPSETLRSPRVRLCLYQRNSLPSPSVFRILDGSVFRMQPSLNRRRLLPTIEVAIFDRAGRSAHGHHHRIGVIADVF